MMNRVVWALLLSLTLGLPAKSVAAVAVSTSATGTAITGSTVTSALFTVDSTADRLLLVFVMLYSGSGSDYISSCTWNIASPESFTRVIGYNGATWSTPDGRDGVTDRHVEVWRLIAPTAGTDDVTCTANGGAEPAMSLVVLALTDVDQTTPITTANILENFGDSSTASVSSITSATGGLVVEGIQAGGTAAPFTADGTEVMDLSYGSQSSAAYYKAGGASISFSHTLSNSTAWISVGVPINEATGGGAPPTSQFRLRVQS